MNHTALLSKIQLHMRQQQSSWCHAKVSKEQGILPSKAGDVHNRVVYYAHGMKDRYTSEASIRLMEKTTLQHVCIPSAWLQLHRTAGFPHQQSQQKG